MPLVTALVMSVMLFVAYAGSNQLDWNLRHMDKPLSGRTISYIAPERKAMIVDNDGLAHQSADLTHPVKRDRSRVVYKNASAAAPELNIVRDDFRTAAPEPQQAPQPPPVRTVPLRMEPVRNEPIRPVMPPPPPASLPVASSSPVVLTGTLVEDSGLVDNDDRYVTEQDRDLTNRVRQEILKDNSLYIVSMHVRVSTSHGVVTLTGEVSTHREKDVIGQLAVGQAGAGNVRNELSVLVG
jgi:hypothetical protein